MLWHSFTSDGEHHVVTAETEFLELLHTHSPIFDNLNFEYRRKVHTDLNPPEKRMIRMWKHVVRTELHNVYKVPNIVSLTKQSPSPNMEKEV